MFLKLPFRVGAAWEANLGRRSAVLPGEGRHGGVICQITPLGLLLRHIPLKSIVAALFWGVCDNKAPSKTSRANCHKGISSRASTALRISIMVVTILILTLTLFLSFLLLLFELRLLLLVLPE